MMRTIRLGLILTSIAARAAQLPSSVQFLPGPVNGLLISGKVLVYGDARDRVKAVRFYSLRRRAAEIPGGSGDGRGVSSAA